MNFKDVMNSPFLRRIPIVFFSCLCLFSIMLLSYGFIAFRDHMNLVKLSRNILQERAYHDFNSIFSGYLYWSDMVDNVRGKNILFIEDQLEEIEEDFELTGVSFHRDKEKFFSTGIDYPTSKTEIHYVVDKKGTLFAGKSFFLKDNEGNEQSDLECSLWLDMSVYIEELYPFLLDFKLVPSSISDVNPHGEVFLGNTRLKSSWINFLIASIKKEPNIPLFLFFLSVLFYISILLMVQKHALKLSWNERLRSLTGILEEKDAYTFGHGHRVAEYSVSIAQSMGIKGKELERINLSAQCHDLGKIFVPDDILNKKGPLTNMEFKYIERHPGDSERIFLNLMKDRELGTIIRHHHERWDGKGYPDGLKERKIPFESRIITLADSFDAMTSQRPYRPAMSMEDALYTISQNSGKQFDPDLVPVAIKALSETYNTEKALRVNYRPEHTSLTFFDLK